MCFYLILDFVNETWWASQDFGECGQVCARDLSVEGLSQDTLARA